MELAEWKNRSGVYFITNDNIKNKTLWVKVGLAKSLEHRLDSYLLYYPKGFQVLCILHTHRKNASKVESVIHAVLRKKIRQMKATHSHSGEWFKLTLKEISTLYESLYALTPNYIMKKHSRNLVDDPWYVESNYRRINQTKTLVLDDFAQRLYDKIHGIKTIQRPKKLKRHSYDGSRKLDFEPFATDEMKKRDLEHKDSDSDVDVVREKKNGSGYGSD
jgi:hypothetical protein